MGKRDEMVHLRFSTRARVPLGRLGYNGTFPRITQAVRLKLRRPLLILRLKLGCRSKTFQGYVGGLHNMQ